MKNTFWLLLLGGIFVMGEGCRHRGAEPREHRRMWRKWSKKSDAFNPHLKNGKPTHAVSRREKREDDKAIRRAKREYQKGVRRSARKRGGK